ncbi:MAG: MATE family efflux transporter, partial [Bacteroidota bacterium]|nr:MATE family efflux transporter [Bacteroidota bacterium]
GAFITAILYLNKTHPVVKLTTWRLHFERAIFKKSLQIGIPSGIQNTIVSVGMITLFSIVNTFGANTAAAYSVSLRIDSLASMIAMNFSAALSTFVGQNIGANKIDRIKKGLVSTLFMSSTLVIIMMAIIINFNEQLISLFTNDIDVIRIGSKYLIIVSSFHLLFSTMFIFNGVMRGAGDTLMPMFFTLIALWFIRIPVAYFLSAEIGVTGIWWATPIGWFFGMTATIIYYFTGRWKKRAIVKYNTN